MCEMFSTRELATGFYLLLLSGWGATSKDVRKAIYKVIKIACQKLFIIPVLCLLAYAAVIVYGLQCLPFWNWFLIKDVILWVLFVAVPICFKAGSRQNAGYPFGQMVRDNFLSAALLEFFIGEFTFALWVEIVIVLPIVTLITILKEYDKNNPQHKQYQKVYDGMAVVAGLIILFFTVKVAIKAIKASGWLDVLVSFLVPVIFSIAFVPIVYLLALKFKYHDLFVRFKIRKHLGDEKGTAEKRKVFLLCGLSYRKLQEFEQAYVEYTRNVVLEREDRTLLEMVTELKKSRKAG